MKSNDSLSSDFINNSIVPETHRFKARGYIPRYAIAVSHQRLLHTVLNCVNSLFYDIHVMLGVLSEYFTDVIYAL